MVSKYFELKTSSEEFKQNLCTLLDNLEGKRVVLYGAGQSFLFLDKIYQITKRLNIIAIADKKFKNNIGETFCNIRAISAEQIKKEDFDYILVTNEQAIKILGFLTDEMQFDENKIKTVFTEKIKDEAENINYLSKFNFDKQLPELVKKLKGKKIILYGAGAFLETINEFYDLSKLDIIGVSDKKFEKDKSEDTFIGYKAIPPEEITKYNPDYVVMTTKYYVKLINILEKGVLYKSGIKIIPFAKKSFMHLYIEFRSL